jgi:hypothetical protein
LSVTELANPDAVRVRLAEDEETLTRWQTILKAIVQRESLKTSCVKSGKKSRARKVQMEKRFLKVWKGAFSDSSSFQKAKGNEPRLKADWKQAR